MSGIEEVEHIQFWENFQKAFKGFQERLETFRIFSNKYTLRMHSNLAKHRFQMIDHYVLQCTCCKGIITDLEREELFSSISAKHVSSFPNCNLNKKVTNKPLVKKVLIKKSNNKYVFLEWICLIGFCILVFSKLM
jgi:hypothetical protein